MACNFINGEEADFPSLLFAYFFFYFSLAFSPRLRVIKVLKWAEETFMPSEGTINCIREGIKCRAGKREKGRACTAASCWLCHNYAQITAKLPKWDVTGGQQPEEEVPRSEAHREDPRLWALQFAIKNFSPNKTQTATWTSLLMSADCTKITYISPFPYYLPRKFRGHKL